MNFTKYFSDSPIYESEEYEQKSHSPEISQTFSLIKLNSIHSFKGRVEYCRSLLDFLGKGSSRIVFRMPNGHALKLAWNSKGIAQNQQEGDDYYKNELDCFAKSFNCSDDFTWVESELARKCSLNEFKRLNGFTFREMQDMIVILARQRGRGDEQKWYQFKDYDCSLKMAEEMCNDEDSIIYCINDYIGNYGASNVVGDFMRIANWGIVNRNGRSVTVIVDNGLTEDVWKEHYSRFSLR